MLVVLHVDAVGFLGVPQNGRTIILPFTAVFRCCTAAVILVWNVPFYFCVGLLTVGLDYLSHQYIVELSRLLLTRV